MEDQKPVEVQKKMMMILIAWLIGWTGLHRKMMGYPKWWLSLVLTPCLGIYPILFGYSPKKSIKTF